MQDQDRDNITQTNEENDEIKETAREAAGAPNSQQKISETPVLGNAADESVHARNVEEVPTVEFIGNMEEIPAVNLNAQEVPTAENTEFQTSRAVEIADVPKVETKEKPFMFNGYEIKTWEFNPRIIKF